MAITLIERIESEIARPIHGSDNKFVKDLKEQLRACKANAGKTAEEVYRAQAFQFETPAKSSSETDEPEDSKEEKLAGIRRAIRYAGKNKELGAQLQERLAKAQAED